MASPRLPPGHEIASLEPSNMSGGGQRLPPDLSRRMEGAFGARFDDVRVHLDAEAHRRNRGYGSQAFAQGRDLHFARGVYDPDTPGGQRIIAHELAHVVQQQQGRVPSPVSPRDLVNDDDRLEGEADVLARRTLDGDSALVPGRAETLGANSAQTPVQLITGEDERKQEEEKKEKEPSAAVSKSKKSRSLLSTTTTTVSSPSSASVNTVYNRQKETKSIFGKREFRGHFFKESDKEMEGMLYPENKGMEDNPMKAARSVASSRLDKALNMNVLSKDRFAKKSDLKELGVEGVFLKSQMVLDGKGVPLTRTISRSPEHTIANRVDLYHPRTQRGLSDLQLMDALTGQTDRHGGNIYVHPETGEVRGIDHDVSMGEGREGDPELASADKPRDKFPGLPSLVDAETAERVLNFSHKDLQKAIGKRSGDQEHLNEKQMEMARRRLDRVKEHLAGLKKDKRLVTRWDDKTYRQAIEEPENTGFGEPPHRNYLQRHFDTFNNFEYVENPEAAGPGRYRSDERKYPKNLFGGDEEEASSSTSEPPSALSSLAHVLQGAPQVQPRESPLLSSASVSPRPSSRPSPPPRNDLGFRSPPPKPPPKRPMPPPSALWSAQPLSSGAVLQQPQEKAALSSSSTAFHGDRPAPSPRQKPNVKFPQLKERRPLPQSPVSSSSPAKSSSSAVRRMPVSAVLQSAESPTSSPSTPPPRRPMPKPPTSSRSAPVRTLAHRPPPPSSPAKSPGRTLEARPPPPSHPQSGPQVAPDVLRELQERQKKDDE